MHPIPPFCDLSDPFALTRLHAHTWIGWALCSLINLFRMLFAVVYFKGMRIKSAFIDIGFWEGAPLAEMCSEWTTVPASHWEFHPFDCCAKVQRKFDAFFVSSVLVLAAFCIVTLTKWWFWHRFVWGPIAHTLRRLSPSNLISKFAHQDPAMKRE